MSVSLYKQTILKGEPIYREFRNENELINDSDIGYPAIEEFWPATLKIKRRVHAKNGKPHNENGPAIEKCYANGDVKLIEYRINGRLHCINPDVPAKQLFNEDGQPILIEFYDNGKLHRDAVQGPAVQHFAGGSPTLIEYYNNGKRDRDEHLGPSYQEFYNGLLYKEFYERNGLRHRDADEPAKIVYFIKSGKIIDISFYKNYKLHRIGKPACVSYDNYGDILCEQYYANDEPHNIYGPAIVDHQQHEVQYALNGKFMSKSVWEEEVKKLSKELP